MTQLPTSPETRRALHEVKWVQWSRPGEWPEEWRNRYGSGNSSIELAPGVKPQVYVHTIDALQDILDAAAVLGLIQPPEGTVNIPKEMAVRLASYADYCKGPWRSAGLDTAEGDAKYLQTILASPPGETTKE